MGPKRLENNKSKVRPHKNITFLTPKDKNERLRKVRWKVGCVFSTVTCGC